MNAGRTIQVAEQEVVRADSASRPTGEPSARLERGFEQHRVGHHGVPVLLEVPGILGDVVFDDRRAVRRSRAHLARRRRDARHEVVGRTGEARHLARTVKINVHRPERVGGATPAAGKQAGPVEGRGRAARRGDVRGAQEGGELGAGERPVGDKFHPHWVGVEALQPIDRTQDLGHEARQRAVVNLSDEDFVHQLLAGGRDLPATTQLERHILDRLETPAILVQGVAAGREQDVHGLQAAIKHQGARHARVVVEVAVEEPQVGPDIQFSSEIATLPRSTVQVERHAVQKEHAVGRGARGPRVGVGTSVTRPERGFQIAVPERLQRGSVQLGARGLGSPGVRAAGAGVVFLGIPEASTRIRQLFIREEARLPIPHRQAVRFADPTVVAEEEHAHIPQLCVLVDADVVLERVPDAGQLGLVGERAAKQPVDAFRFVEEVDPLPAA